MNNDQFNELVKEIKGPIPKNQRYGQWAYNCLAKKYPSIAAKINATDHDPFHKCSKVDKFIAFISQNYVGN